MTRKTFALIAALLLCVTFIPFGGVRAEGETPSVVDTTAPVDTFIRESVNGWLAESAPINLPYWAITYVEVRGTDSLVSLAALNIAAPADRWRITDENTVSWMGTVIVHVDGYVDMYSTPPEQSSALLKLALSSLSAVNVSAFKLAAPLSAGGGSYLRFPWKQGGSMMYGPRGVHDAGGGGAYATGFSAVDFVGGDDMGSGVANSNVYAVGGGVVDYVCADDTTTLVRTYDEDKDDYFIYAHLLDNSNLAMDHEFSTGGFIGALKYGSFDDNCGWAEQQDDHYHLHFGFEPANNAFRMEGCILNTSTQKWLCGDDTVSTGEFLRGGGGVGSGSGNDGGTAVDQPSFWDYVVLGVITIWDRTVIAAMPEHTATQYTYALFTSAKVAIKVARVLVYSNVNLGPLIAVLIFGLGIRGIFGIAEFIVFLFKAWKSLVPVLGA